MAQKQVTTLVDDLTGQEIADGKGESLTFAINGVEYSIDLNAKNAKKFHDTMALYIDHGTRVSGRRRSGAGRVASGRDYDPKSVRAWAAANNVDVPSRGRIPVDVVKQYRAQGN